MKKMNNTSAKGTHARRQAGGMEQGVWSLERPGCHQGQRDNMNYINKMNNYKHQNMNNKPGQAILSGSKYKTVPCLPQGGFNSGVCPGAAAITILYTYTGSPRGTLGGSHAPAVTNSHTTIHQPAGLVRHLAETRGRHKTKEDLPMI